MKENSAKASKKHKASTRTRTPSSHGVAFTETNKTQADHTRKQLKANSVRSLHTAAVFVGSPQQDPQDSALFASVAGSKTRIRFHCLPVTCDKGQSSTFVLAINCCGFWRWRDQDDHGSLLPPKRIQKFQVAPRQHVGVK